MMVFFVFRALARFGARALRRELGFGSSGLARRRNFVGGAELLLLLNVQLELLQELLLLFGELLDGRLGGRDRGGLEPRVPRGHGLGRGHGYAARRGYLDGGLRGGRLGRGFQERRRCCWKL